MMNQNVSTKLGATILVIIAITAGAFVWVVIKNQEVVEAPQNVVSVKKPVAMQAPEINQQDQKKTKETTLKKSTGDDVYVYYDGNITVSGNYQVLSPNTILGGTLCFYADSETGYLIPRDPNLYGSNNGDNRNPWFCFSDQDSAKSMFGINDKNIFSNKSASTSCIKGKTTIEVSNYVINKGESEVYDTAKLEKIITKEKYSFLEKCN